MKRSAPTSTENRRMPREIDLLNRQPTRVAHPLRSYRKGWNCTAVRSRGPGRGALSVRGIALGATALLWLAPAAHGLAESPECSQMGIRHSGLLAYPMIGRAAHVSGTVNLTAHFQPDGSFEEVRVEGGPEMLRTAATEYVSSWSVGPTASGLTCPIAIAFKIAEGDPGCDREPSSVTMSDTRHFTVTTKALWTCDPSGSILITHYHFLFIHWHSKPIMVHHA